MVRHPYNNGHFGIDYGQERRKQGRGGGGGGGGGARDLSETSCMG